MFRVSSLMHCKDLEKNKMQDLDLKDYDVPAFIYFPSKPVMQSCSLNLMPLFAISKGLLLPFEVLSRTMSSELQVLACCGKDKQPDFIGS